METQIERRRRLLGSRVRQYYDAPFQPVRGEGVRLYDAGGRAYLDAYNNVPHVGYCHPAVVEAICRQTRTLNTNTRYFYDSILDYADRLVGLMPPALNVCVFTCTGSEANDLAWRMARCVTRADGAITTTHGYHGNTTFLDSIDGSSSTATRPGASWWRTIPAPTREPYPDAPVGAAIDDLERNGHKPAAFLVDSTFCSDGIRIPAEGALRTALDRIRGAGGLVIADELQASLGRLGQHLWSWERLGAVPDIVTLGKPLGNGEPVGAVVTRREILEEFQARERYFSTFAGNPVACVAGMAVLDVMDREKLQENARDVGLLLAKGLEQLAVRYDNIGEVRGLGFLYGVEICRRGRRDEAGSQEARWLLNEIFRRGVLVGLTGPNRNAMNVLKIRPPMTFSAANANQLLTVLGESLSALERQAL